MNLDFLIGPGRVNYPTPSRKHPLSGATPTFGATAPDKVELSRQSMRDAVGLDASSRIQYQLSPPQLTKKAVERNEGTLSAEGVLVVETGPKYTGRSPKDRFIVDTPTLHNQIGWNKENIAISPEVFDKVQKKITDYLKGKEVFVFDGISGADPKYAMPVRFYNERAAQNLFVHQMFIRPNKQQLAGFKPEFTVLAAPGLKLDPATDGVRSEVGILVNLEKKMILIAGTQYSGELKKGIFGVMNYRLPEKNVLPLHSAATVVDKDKVSLIVGLSGTGKTTLALSPDQTYIGDDEVGWSEEGVFNFEGGCYATANHLTQDTEPMVWKAIKKGTVAENVVLDPTTKALNFQDSSLSENSRVAFPIRHIAGAKRYSMIEKHPTNLVFLTSDAFGVLPPISKLSKEQAMYHFINGYTSKMGGTERGVEAPQATFSAGFAAPFLPKPIGVYARMLADKIKNHPLNVYLINTGWQGGSQGVGKRLGLPETRAILKAAIHGDLEKQQFVEHPIFKIQVPKSCPGVPDTLLDPKSNWQDKTAYDNTAQKLLGMFQENFKAFPDLQEWVDAWKK